MSNTIRSVRVFAGAVESASPEFAGTEIPAALVLVELDRSYECKFLFFVGGAIAMTVHAPRDQSNELRGRASDPRGWDTEFDADLRGNRVVGTYRQPHDHGTFVLDEM
jgi:hypothetical protein